MTYTHVHSASFSCCQSAKMSAEWTAKCPMLEPCTVLFYPILPSPRWCDRWWFRTASSVMIHTNAWSPILVNVLFGVLQSITWTSNCLYNGKQDLTAWGIDQFQIWQLMTWIRRNRTVALLEWQRLHFEVRVFNIIPKGADEENWHDPNGIE